MISKEKCSLGIKSLIKYAKETGLLDPADEIFAVNCLLRILKLEAYEIVPETSLPFPECLSLLTDYGVENGLTDNTVTGRDLFDTKIMGELTPRPSSVTREFWSRYSSCPVDATDYFYKLSRDCNYIRQDRVSKDMHWTVETQYGQLEVSINLSKPEKDPKEIAAAKLKKSSGYPKCLLCFENEGYEGTISHPARENLRIIPIDICDEQWGFQYSPYVYYNEHCIVMNSHHIPMAIDETVFNKLFSFVEKFPHYFVGSNADLPIVGGSILSHEHFQGGHYSFPMEKAGIEYSFIVGRYTNVECSVLNYPMTVIRLNGENKQQVCALASEILQKWRNYTDEGAFIYAETNGEPHNTITPIARMHNEKYELDLVLRNNITTDEHPLGVFHPHSHLHHIKKENIGLIEVMGLAILPGRLKEEMSLLTKMLLDGTDPRTVPVLEKHAAWSAEFMSRRNDWCEESAERIIQEEIGKVYTEVLECSGVFKHTEEGRAALIRFIESLG